MTKQETIVRLCILIGEVGKKVYTFTEPAECICGNTLQAEDPVISNKVIEYIEAAVYTAINNQSHNEGD
jgi:hypothetical protein